jgi:GNAT superfamily N-acetyltransferase
MWISRCIHSCNSMKKYSIKYLRSKFKYDTFPKIVLDALKLARIRISPIYIYQEGLDLAPADLKTDKLNGYKIGFAGREEMPRLTGFPDRIEPLRKLNKRLDRGGLCIAAWSGGEIAAFSWASLKEFSYEAFERPLGEHEAYLHDAYTAKEHRGRGLILYLRYRLYQELSLRGRHTLFSISERFNPPSLRFKNKLGAKIVGSSVSLDLFGLWKTEISKYPLNVHSS